MFLLKIALLKHIHSQDHKKLCELIRQVREERGITQRILAERLDVPQSFVSKIETGERRLDLLELRSVCVALDCSLKRFVQRLEEEFE